MAVDVQHGVAFADAPRELTDEDMARAVCPDCMSEGTQTVQPLDVVVRVAGSDDVLLARVAGIVCGVCGHESVDAVNAAKVDALRAVLARGERRDMERVASVYRAEAL